MFTYGQLIAKLRPILWPTGEAPNLVPDHDQRFIDCLIDLQTWVPCLQKNNTHQVPQCATVYQCGVTMFDAPPHAIIKELYVIDKINPDTGIEDATAADDWCSRIDYREVEACYVHNYLNRSRRCGSCYPAALWFGLAQESCQKAYYPVPTDVGVPVSLPILPLGFHYGQTSTDSTHGRALSGVWAKERGKLWLVPWLQSTETVVVVWDGIKRTWADGDPMDADPLVELALTEWSRWKHADKWEKDEAEASRAQTAYVDARAMLIHQCREETRVRYCEPSHAQGGIGNLYYNEEQTATAHCPAGSTGADVTQVIPAGTVASLISVADANKIAKNQAITQAQARLDCVSDTAVFWNVAAYAQASCTGDPDAPPPDGNSTQVTIPAHTYSAATQAEADALAQAAAQAAADAALTCTWWNKEVSETVSCPENPGISETRTTNAHSFPSTLSQDDANHQASLDAIARANAALSGQCVSGDVQYNTELVLGFRATQCTFQHHPCVVYVTVHIKAGCIAGQTVAIANTNANNYGTYLQIKYGGDLCGGLTQGIPNCGRKFYIKVDGDGQGAPVVHGPSIFPIP